MAEPTQLVISCLLEAKAPLTAQEIQKATKLPLPIVTRLLQNLANESLPDVERLNDADRIVYRYIGLGANAEKMVANGAPSPAKPAAGRNTGATLKAVPSAQKTTPHKVEKPAPQKVALAKGAKPKASPASKQAATTKAAPQSTTKATGVTSGLFSEQEAAAPRSELKVVKPAKAAATGTDYREIYRRIAESLSVPQTAARLIKATGLNKGLIQTALDALVDAELVTRKEVPEFNDIIYRAVGDLAKAVETAPLPQLGAAEQVVALEVAGANSAFMAMQASMDDLKARLADEAVAFEALARAEALVTDLRAQVEVVSRLREAAEAVVARYEALMNQG